jgi:adenylate cyclase
MMNRLSIQALAERAGVEAGHVERLVGLAILVPDGEGTFAPAAVRRIQVVDMLVRAGLPLEGLAEALRRDELSLDFVEQPSYDRFAALGSATFHEISEERKIPVELLMVMREATGFAQPQPGDRVRESELAILSFLEVNLGQGVLPEHLERSLRVTGDSMRRVAETEASWWRSDILEPLFQSDLPMSEIGRRTERFASESTGATDQALLAIFHGQQTHAWVQNIFEGFELLLTRLGLYSPEGRPPAICFLDLTGYTRLTDERGDEAAADLAGKLTRIVQRTSTEHRGKAIKWLGDGVMFHFRDPGAAVVAALSMVDAASSAGLPPAHVGLHAGPVLFQEGDYFGRTVNAAARIAEYARQGEVLVSQEVVDATDVDGISFDPIGPVELKGLSGPLTLHAARWASRTA